MIVNTVQKVIIVLGIAALVLFCGLYPPTYVEKLVIPNLKYFQDSPSIIKYDLASSLIRGAFISALTIALVFVTKSKSEEKN